MYAVGSTQKNASTMEDQSPALTEAMGKGGGHVPMIFKTNTKLGYDVAHEGDGINLSFPRSRTRRGRVIKNNSPTLQVVNQIGTIQDTKIRRLTPTECERLMSWPDHWTKWGINEKGETIEMSDNQRYKMCGNGVVSAVVKELQQVLNF